MNSKSSTICCVHLYGMSAFETTKNGIHWLYCAGCQSGPRAAQFQLLHAQTRTYSNTCTHTHTHANTRSQPQSSDMQSLCTTTTTHATQVISIGFEVLELSLGHMLPNFNECWYDSWILDVGVCNFIGISVGMATVRWMDCKYERWDVFCVCFVCVCVCVCVCVSVWQAAPSACASTIKAPRNSNSSSSSSSSEEGEERASSSDRGQMKQK